MTRKFFLALPLFLIGNAGFANVECKSGMRSYLDIIACAESRSPEIQTAQLELGRAKAEVGAAGQWKNPQLSAETFRGKVGSEQRSETDIALAVPIELGGKISARTAVATGGVSVAEAKLFEARAKVRSQVLVKLHRLRQVLHEQEIVEEAIRTFSKLISQYSKRPGLSPEQQVSYSVYQLSRGEYDLRRSETVDEILELNSYFKFTLGLSADEIKGALPESPRSWPTITTEKSVRLSPQQKILQAELDTANAGLSLARSEAWPTLTVGPSFQMQTEAGRSNNLVGVNVSLPLPLFNANGGAKVAAAASVQVSEARRTLGLREQDLRREQLIKTYEQSIKTLGTSISHKEIEKRHTDAERLFSKGIVPSSLIIEAHRTSFELEKTRHEREIHALEALLNLYAIDGNILEVNL